MPVFTFVCEELDEAAVLAAWAWASNASNVACGSEVGAVDDVGTDTGAVDAVCWIIRGSFGVRTFNSGSFSVSFNTSDNRDKIAFGKIFPFTHISSIFFVLSLASGLPMESIS